MYGTVFSGFMSEATHIFHSLFQKMKINYKNVKVSYCLDVNAPEKFDFD